MHKNVWRLCRLQYIICAIETQGFFSFDILLGGYLLFEVGSLKLFSQERFFLPRFQKVKDTNNGVLNITKPKSKQKKKRRKYIHLFNPKLNVPCHLAGKEIAALTKYFPYCHDLWHSLWLQIYTGDRNISDGDVHECVHQCGPEGSWGSTSLASVHMHPDSKISERRL